MIFIGSVENIKDPLKIGRLKVRVQGVHAPASSLLPTEDLPWASPMHPITSAAYEGIGYGGCGVVVGSQVVVIFRDHGQFQQPVVIGTLPGLFNGDEDSTIRPGKESDLGRFATNNLIDKTIVQTKRDNVQVAESDVVNFSEPPTPYDTEYGESDVYMSRSGHIVEFDDTPEKERIHQYHRSGTFTEIHPDGTVVVRTEGDVFEINKKTVNIYTESNKQELIVGNSNTNVSGNVVVNIVGNSTVTIKGNSKIDVSGNTDVSTGGTMNVSSGGPMNISAGGNMKLTAPKIDLN